MKEKILGILNEVKRGYFSSVLLISDKECKKTANLFAVLALVFGIILIYLNPPMVCPDENAHYMNICRITGGSIFADMQDGVTGSLITQDQADFINNYKARYLGIDAEKYTFKEAYFLSHLNYTGNQKIFFESYLSGINPAAYIVQSTGVCIAQALFPTTSPYNLLIWAKLSNLVFFVIVTRIAILKAPALRNTMFLIALMPMTIYQCSSASYDAAVIACSFLLFSYSLKLIRADENYRVSIEDIIAICFSCAFIFAGKIAYAPIVLILFAVSIKKFGNIKRYITCISLVVACGVFFYLIPTALTEHFTSGALNVLSEQPIVIEQKEYFNSHIGSIFEVIINSVSSTFMFWVNGYFGILGGLDINFPQPFIYLYYAILLTTSLIELSVLDKVNIPSRILSIIGVLTFFIGTAIAMYTEWTPLVTGVIGGDSFTGIQGRYFIPVTLFALLLFANQALMRFKFSNRILEIQTSIVRITVVGYLCLTCLMLLTKIWI